MTPLQFIEKWKKSQLKERAAAQEHFLDLCRLLEHPTPAEADPEGTWYTFEYGIQKTTGSSGFADVWKKGFFGWEYKGKHKDLQAAYSQLQQYAPALANPPLLIVCDTDRFVIHTNWNDLVSEKHEIALDEIADPYKLGFLRNAFHDPDKLKPKKSRQQLTEEVAGKFAEISEQLRKRGNEPHIVAHFVNRLIFCMFAEDTGLLRKGLFTDLLENGIKQPDDLQRKLSSLFEAMNKGASWGIEDILWFNGGLFDDDTALRLEPLEIRMIHETAKKDWSDIDPSIMGTLFERGLDPSKRNQWGAHYTDRDMIMKIITPVIIDPLLNEWEEIKIQIQNELIKASQQKAKNTSASIGNATKAENKAKELFNKFKVKLGTFKVLDPACGSGNFLYLALNALKDIENNINLHAEKIFGNNRELPEIGPSNIYGIEINPYAAELARVSVWVGEIQWLKKHGFTIPSKPILKKLNNIVCHDALMNDNGTEYNWPKVDVVVGNPPFIGDKKMIRELGEEYTNKVRKCYDGRVAGGADFVCFWFVKCYDYMKQGWLQRAGLVSTNSITGGKNRLVLDSICNDFQIYNAWSDEEWFSDGAAVRVSMTCFSMHKFKYVHLDGITVDKINSSLELNSKEIKIDPSKIKKFSYNSNLSFQGTVKAGSFEIPYETAVEWIKAPANPNGRKNSDVLFPWVNGKDLTGRRSNTWIIDFGTSMSLAEASLFEKPFHHLEKFVRPVRQEVRRQNHREKWWLYGETRPAMRKALSKFERYICTPRVSKHRIFVWLDKTTQPDCATVAIASESDAIFGILSSKYHTLWSLKLCTWLGAGNDPRYTPSTTFETFPFPNGIEPNRKIEELLSNSKAQKIAEAAIKMNNLRENWLNPTGSTKRVPEIVAGYPDRILPADKSAEKILAKRTLTNLYNEMPTWLKNAHKELDDAVAEAYGWPTDLSDDEILEKLFALNQERRNNEN